MGFYSTLPPTNNLRHQNADSIKLCKKKKNKNKP